MVKNVIFYNALDVPLNKLYLQMIINKRHSLVVGPFTEVNRGIVIELNFVGLHLVNIFYFNVLYIPSSANFKIPFIVNTFSFDELLR